MPPKPKRKPEVHSKMKPAHQSVPPKTYSDQAMQYVHAPNRCTYCESSGADFQCCLCGALYCGFNCQLPDWPTHRNQCIPRLVKATPVYVPPEFRANMNNSPNPSHSNSFPTMAPGNSKVQANFQQPPDQAIFPQPPNQEHFPYSALANFPKQSAHANIPKQPAQANFPKPPDQEHFPQQPAKAKRTNPSPQANSPKPPANFNMTPTQAIVTKSTMLVHQANNFPVSMDLINFSEPPPTVSVPPSAPVNVPKRGEEGPSDNGGSLAAKIKNQNLLKKQEVKQKNSPPAKLPDPAIVKGADNRSSILSALLPNATEAGATLGASQSIPVVSNRRPIPVLTSGRKVRITHIGKNQIYIYGTGIEPDGTPNQYFAFMKRSLEAAREVKQCLHAPPSKYDMVFAPFEGEYYRAIVKSIDGSNVSLIFPEFGNSTTVAWTKLKDITDPDIKYAPLLVFKALIDNVTNFTLPQYEFLHTLVENEEFQITKVTNMPNSYLKVDLQHTLDMYMLSDKLRALPAEKELEKAAVPVLVEKESVPNKPNASSPTNDEGNTTTARELVDPTPHINLANTDSELTETPVLVEKESVPNQPNASPPTNDEGNTTTARELVDPTPQINLETLSLHTYSPVLVGKFQDASLPTGNDVKLLIVDVSELAESNTITVVLHSEMDRYNKLKDACNRIGNSDPYPYQQAQPEEACLIKRDGKWWRAVRCMAKDQYLLLDLGCIYTLNEKSDVRRYPAELSRELFTTDCIIDNPRMLQFAMACRGNSDGLLGQVLQADVFQKDEVYHARIVDLLLE